MTHATLASAAEKATFSKVSRRILPFLFLAFFASYLNRTNIGFA